MVEKVNKIMVTNNEFLDIQKKEANIYWKKVLSIDSSVSKEELKTLKAQYLKEFNSNLDKYDVIPFENENSKIKEILNTYFSRSEEKEGRTCYKGHLYDDYSSYIKILDSLNLKELIDTGYYRAAYNSDKKIIFEYCEGDIFLEISKDKSTFNNRFDRTIQFIKENY